MPLLNYTTKIDAHKTASQIQEILRKHGASAVLIEYDWNGEIAALSFNAATPHGDVGFRLPVDAEATLRVLQKSDAPPRLTTKEHAVRVSWRIIKDWVEAQMAILETQMVTLDQIFLPYLVFPEGDTLYQRMVDIRFQLKEGSG